MEMTASPIAFLIGVVKHAPMNTNLRFQTIEALRHVGDTLRWIGKPHFEQYIAEAVLLGCFGPRPHTAGYDLMLRTITFYDRRRPNLLPPDAELPFETHEQQLTALIRLLEDKKLSVLIHSMEAIEACGYARTRPKAELLILLARQLCGQPLLAEPSAEEERHMQLLGAEAPLGAPV